MNTKVSKTFWIILVVVLECLLCFGCVKADEPETNELYRHVETNELYMHISVDDTIAIFEDINNNQHTYSSIFDNELLGYFKTLHDKYGIVVSFYCFYENNQQTFNLSQMTTKFQSDFQENADWMRFGFHGRNENIKYSEVSAEESYQDYTQLTSALLKITGSTECLDNVVRLHYYAGTSENISVMASANNGIIGLLSADDDRLSYYLDEEQNSLLRTNDIYIDKNTGMLFTPTDLRMENITNIQRELSKFKTQPFERRIYPFIVFTHEWILSRRNVKHTLEECILYFFNREYDFAFPEDRMEDSTEPYQ